MSEVFPVVAGLLMSHALGAVEKGVVRVRSWLISAALLGLVSSALSRELSVSWMYWGVDTLLIWSVALTTSSLMAAARRRALPGLR